MSRYDVIIVGAGAAGLNALRLLHNAGRKVLCLEARDRLGGRIYTVRDHRLPLPIELGPEFIHGRPPQTWNLIRQAGLAAYDCEGSAVHLRHGTPFEPPESWDQIDEVTEEMKRWEARGQETTFDDFLHRTNFPPAIQESARNYVEGFNAARSERISIASLAQDARAAEAIGGDSNFRIANGYDAIPQFLASGLHGCIRMGEAVEAVVWQPREVKVTTRSCLSGSETTYTASQIIVTVPLGVLQARSIRFSPVPEAQLMAADRLCFGQVVRMVALFRRAWWEDIGHLSDSGFWLSDEKYVPTWWTALPFRSPLLVGWSSGPHADQLIGKTQPEQLHIALLDLARVTQTPVEKVKSDLERFLCHDWSVDPYALGAYSYVPAGAMDARAALAEPLLGTVYFAGEATDLHGHSATVHGALATGERAARAILSL